MPAIIHILQSLDDRMNPIVVKELRQAVAGKFVAAVLLLFLTVQLVALGSFLLAGVENDMDAGREIFLWLQGILLFTCLLFIPAYAALRLNAERSSENTDLLFVTTLRPRAIIGGKFLSALIITILIYSACTPFLSLTYLLRGIDLPTIFLLLGIGFIVVAACIMFALFLACIPANRVLKALMAFIALGVLLQVFGLMTALSVSNVAFGLGGSATGWDFWLPWAAAVLALAAFIGLLFTLAIAMISPPSSNRARPVRIYLTTAWLLTGLFFFGWSYYESTPEPASAWLVLAVSIFCIALLASVSERDRPGPRLTRSIPRNPLLRPLAFLSYSGAAGGVAWTLLLLALTLGTGVAWLLLVTGYSPTATYAPLADSLHDYTQFTLYILAYTLTALFLRRTLFRDALPTTNTYALALILMGIGTVLPLIIALMISDRPYDLSDTAWFVTVPFMALESSADQPTRWWFAGLWALWAFTMNLPWLLSRYHSFRPPAPADQHNDLPESPKPDDEPSESSESPSPV